MDFLTPLYAAGAAAIALPILFHLIRRTPHSRVVFSSLMFLVQSPPRLTRRSRLNNILLLILRAAALALLALAFARPFFIGAAENEAPAGAGRRVALLLDASASMRRGDLWSQAVRQAEQALTDVAPADEVALYLFDDRVRPAMTFTEWRELESSRRLPILKARLAEAKPTWAGTKLGEALATVADLLAEAEAPAKDKAAPRSDDKSPRQLVLVSDLQQGGHVEALQGHQWPRNVVLDVRPVSVAPAKQTNATVELARDAADDPARDPTRLRVRVSNQPGAAREQFTLAWATDRGPLAGTSGAPQATASPLPVYVPPGQSQLVKVPWPDGGQKADRLLLQGDDHDFDNTLFIVPPRVESIRVLFVGDDAPDDVQGLSYYLRSAAADTARRKVELVTRRPAEPLAATDLVGTRLVVVAGAPPEPTVAALKRFAESGGDVAWVLKDAAAQPGVRSLLGSDEIAIQEAPARDFALIARVDTRHPLFAPFADARFGDFSRIHFWKHRRVTLPAASATGADALRVLARFDDGDPFLLERALGKGRAILATSGWHPADSQLALSTKFVPLIDGLTGRPDPALAEAHHVVHEPIALPGPKGDVNPQVRKLTGPDGKAIDLPATATTFEATDLPGVYRLTVDGRDIPLAVNVPPDEGRTAPLAAEDLERWGAQLGTKQAPEDVAARDRRLKQAELENKQKVWRWLILAVLGLLAAETFLGGRLARRKPEESAAPT